MLDIEVCLTLMLFPIFKESIEFLNHEIFPNRHPTFSLLLRAANWIVHFLSNRREFWMNWRAMPCYIRKLAKLRRRKANLLTVISKTLKSPIKERLAVGMLTLLQGMDLRREKVLLKVDRAHLQFLWRRVVGSWRKSLGRVSSGRAGQEIVNDRKTILFCTARRVELGANFHVVFCPPLFQEG